MSRIPRHTNEYFRYLELCITALEKIEKDEALKRPTVAKVISSSLEYLYDYRDDIRDRRKRRNK